MFQFLARLFRRRREYETNGGLTRNGIRYDYRTHIKTGEREVSTRGFPVDFVGLAPRDVTIRQLRDSAEDKGIAWLQSKEVRKRSE